MEQRGRILVVDDDVICIGILLRILHNEYILETATSGSECLAKLLEFKPQLVLLDVMLPGINGHETCRRIKFSSLGEHVRIILVSAKETIVDKSRGSDILADDYIIKPFDHGELLSKVHAQFCVGETPTDSESLGNHEMLAQQRSLASQRCRTVQEKVAWTERNRRNR